MTSIYKRLGYYMVDSYIFFNKGDALIHASKTGKDVTWYFNDDIFSAIDWSIPIDTSLTELYKQRAQQLRDKYDYVSLFFSGGVDSTNILHAFIDNGILLDEIVTWRPKVTEDRINDKDKTPYNLCSETVLAAQPHLRQYVTDSRTRIRIIYSDEAIAKFVSDSTLRSQFPTIYEFMPNALAKTAIGLTDPLWHELYEAGKKVCHVHGADKPLIFADQSSYHFTFRDSGVGFAYEPIFHSDLTDMISKHQFHEMFYWTPDLPQLVIKQCQVVKKLCETDATFYRLFSRRTNRTQDTFASMLPYIYPPHVTEVRNIFTTSSPGPGIYTLQNLWFYEKMPSHIVGAFNDIVKNCRDMIDDRFFKTPGAPETNRDSLYAAIPKSAYENIFSKKYIL